MGEKKYLSVFEKKQNIMVGYNIFEAARLVSCSRCVEYLLAEFRIREKFTTTDKAISY